MAVYGGTGAEQLATARYNDMMAQREEQRKAKAQQAQAIFESILKGEAQKVKPGETADIFAPSQPAKPQGMGQAIMQGLGIQQPQMEPGQGYKVQPSLDRQIKQATLSNVKAQTDYYTGANQQSGGALRPALSVDEAKKRVLASGESPDNYDYEQKNVITPMGSVVSYEPKLKPEVVDERKRVEKLKTETSGNVKAATNLMIPMVQSFRTMRDTTKKQTGIGAGRVAGVINTLTGSTGLNPDVAGLESQKLDTAAALARIAMPGIRSEQAIHTFYKMLPNKFSTDAEVESKIRNAVHNAFSRNASAQGRTYGEQDKAQAEQFISEVLSQGGWNEGTGNNVEPSYEELIAEKQRRSGGK